MGWIGGPPTRFWRGRPDRIGGQAIFAVAAFAPRSDWPLSRRGGQRSGWARAGAAAIGRFKRDRYGQVRLGGYMGSRQSPIEAPNGRASTPPALFAGLAAPRRVTITSFPRPSRTVESRPCSGISWWVHGRCTARFACDIASPGTHCEIQTGSDSSGPPNNAAGLGEPPRRAPHSGAARGSASLGG
jgi:hypothetical protein